ncbi:hypothetical protein [Legionella brunensis]|uniref:Dot/Icm system substrate protein LidA n=1 Tax=Legionella brunensis TaxID=29422 RepID=A0A0W0SLB6_9GAMM|nr:hypothetical protein [Legionella brunensis]KTC84123.1 Dot/Icm system substrate protein LidA [Legionella brunensis]
MANTTKITEALRVQSTLEGSPKKSMENALEMSPKKSMGQKQISPSPSKEDESIQLRSKAGNSVSLTASQLEKWFATLEARELKQDRKEKHIYHPNDPEVNPSYLATIYLSRYGLKTAKDVITFLKSPAGRDVQAMIGERLAEIASIENEIHQQQLDAETRRQRALAALLLGLLYEKEAEAKIKNAEIQKDIDKKLHHTTETTSGSTSKSEAYAAVAAYSESIAALEKILKDKVKESEELEEEFDKLDELALEIASRYHHLDQHITTLDHFGLLVNSFYMSHEERIKAIEALEAKINQLKGQTTSSAEAEQTSPHEQISTMLITLSLMQAQLKSPTSTIELMEARAKDLEKTLKKQANSIGDLLAGNSDNSENVESSESREQRAKQLLHEHNGLHVQFAGLNDMIGVMKGEKKLWDKQGQPVTSIDKAAFVISSKKSLVFHQGEYYLLNGEAPENFDELPQKVKDEAKRNFDQARPEITSLKRLVHHNKQLEEHDFSQRKEDLTQRSEIMQKEMLLLTNQLTKLQSSKANMEILIQQLDKQTSNVDTNTTPSVSIPTLKPTLSKGSKTTTNNNTAAYVQGYKHTLLLMRNNPTPDSVQRLRNFFMGPDGKTPVPSTIETILSSIKYGRPIPLQTMQNLLQNMNRLGLAMAGPNRRALQTPELIEEVNTAPSPFKRNLTPKPY